MNATRPSTAHPRSRRLWLALALIILAGAALRWLYLTELRQAPDFTSPTADAAYHDYWARALATGDWTPPEGVPDPGIREHAFLRPPGYPYFLAAVYELGGDRHLGARLAQMALGLLAGFLGFLLGRSVYGRAGGLVLAALCVTSWTGLYFEGELHAPALLSVLLLTLVLVLGGWRARPGAARSLVAGLVVGVLALVRPNYLLLLPALATWMILGGAPVPRPRRWLGAGLLAAGCLLGIAPATLRNLAVEGSPVAVSAGAGVNLYLGNHAGADGHTLRLPEDLASSRAAGWSCFSYADLVGGLSRQEGRDLSYAEADAVLLRRALAEIGARPGRFLALTLRRAALFWGPAEVSNNKVLALEKEHSRVLRRLPGFPWVLGLALLGVGLLVRTIRRARGDAAATSPAPRPGAARDPLLVAGIVVVTVCVSTLPFVVAGRFRAPLVPLLCLFATHALLAIGASARRGAWPRAAGLAGAGLILVLVSSIQVVGYEPDPAWWHTDRALAWERRGEPILAEAEFRAALAANPGFVDAHVQYAALLARGGRHDEALRHYVLVLQQRPQRHDVRLAIAIALIDAGRHAEAVPHLRLLAAETPETAMVHFALGRALSGTGDYEGSREAFRRYLQLDPQEPAAFMNLGVGHVKEKRYADAVTILRQAIEMKPDLAPAYLWLGRAHEGLGEIEEALRSFETAHRLDPTRLDPLMELGRIQSARGDHEAALAAYRRAVALDGTDLIVRHNLAGELGNAGRLDEAAAELETILRLDPGNRLARQRLEQVRRMAADGR